MLCSVALEKIVIGEGLSLADYREGANPPSFDKQFVRDWLETQPWDKRPPAPALPPEVVEGTARRYRLALEMLTGRS